MSPVPERVKKLVAQTCAVDPARVREDARLIEYGLDSVRGMDLIVALEEAFAIEIPDGAAGSLRTVSDVVRLVESLRRGTAGSSPS